MTREEILATRENDRIHAFIKSMAEQGLLSESELFTIGQVEDRIEQQAGYLTKDGEHNQFAGDEYHGVIGHINHLLRAKIDQLHPEMTAELVRQIEEKKYHPLPVVPPELEKPGAALAEFRSLVSFVDAKGRSGQISRDVGYDITAPMQELLEDEGVHHFEVNLNTNKALLVQASRLLRQKLLEYCPELKDEISNLEEHRSR